MKSDRKPEKRILYLHAGAEMYGADKVLLDLILHLDKTRFKPYVVLPERGVLLDALKEHGIRATAIPYPIMRRKFFNPKGILQYVTGFFRYTHQIKVIAKKHHIDLIHTNTAAVLEGCMLSKGLKIPQLWSIHEIIETPRVMYRFTSRLISGFANITVTDSCAVKRHLEASGYFKPGQIRVIYNGVDAGRFHPQESCDYLYKEWDIPEDALIIGMMGRVNSWKGQKDFLEAAGILMEKYPQLYTVMIGSAFRGEEWREKELADIIAASPYKDRIINRGYRTDSQAIYKLLDVFVLPSTNPDPLPTVVLEAMATGKPVVGYRHGGVCEMVEENTNGLFAEVRNPADLAQKIDLLLSDEQLRKQMGIRSRERLLECFSMKSYVDHYSEAYAELL